MVERMVERMASTCCCPLHPVLLVPSHARARAPAAPAAAAPRRRSPATGWAAAQAAVRWPMRHSHHTARLNTAPAALQFSSNPKWRFFTAPVVQRCRDAYRDLEVSLLRLVPTEARQICAGRSLHRLNI